MLRRETALRGWRCYWPVNRASRRGSSWGAGAVAPLFLREGRQHVGLRSGQQRASRASSHPGAPQGQRRPTSLVKGGALPTTKVKPRHDLRCRRTQQIPSSGLSPPGGGGSAASPHTRAGPVAARAALALLTVLRAGEALLTPRPAQGAGHRQPWAVCSWHVAAGGVTSRPARVRGDEETASEASLPCSR